MIVDVHAHYFPKAYTDLLLRIGGRSLPEAALLCAWKAFGADHLVAGSDYPVLLSFETYRQTFHYIREAGLPAEDVDKILNHNAQMFLGLAH